tara:strand:- start:2504 stop:3634 length:1131 start_codon:yes stop_codon:yes gene_type:complete
MNKFNLMQVIPSLDSGGVEQGTIDLANFLAEKKIDSLIVSNGGKLLPKLNYKKVKHIKLPVHSKNFIKMPYLAKKLKNLIKENNVNIVHVRSRAPAWLLKFMKNNSFKTVSTFHNVYGVENFLKRKYNYAMGEVDYIIAISDYVKSQISEIYKINSNKITVINRGINTKFFDAKIKNNTTFSDFLSKYNISGEKKIILFPGRLTKWKGQIEFLNILESFRNKKIICYFVGDDKNESYTTKLINEINKRKIASNCKILGHLSYVDLKMMYFCTDVVISAPLKPEGFGRIVGESLAMKKLLLAYNFGGVKSQLSGLNQLYTVAPYDQLEMKNKIDHALKLSKSYINKLGTISRKHIINNFSNEKMLKNYLNFYQKISK